MTTLTAYFFFTHIFIAHPHHECNALYW